jgi:hypothetical protein
VRAPTLQKNDQESNGSELFAPPTSSPTSPMARPSKFCTTKALNVSASTGLRDALAKRMAPARIAEAQKLALGVEAKDRVAPDRAK